MINITSQPRTSGDVRQCQTACSHITLTIFLTLEILTCNLELQKQYTMCLSIISWSEVFSHIFKAFSPFICLEKLQVECFVIRTFCRVETRNRTLLVPECRLSYISSKMRFITSICNYTFIKVPKYNIII